MSDPHRLLESGDELERALLASARDPHEDRERAQRTLLALGLDFPPTPGTDGSGGNGGGGAAGTGLGAAAKWLGGAAAAAAVAAGAAFMLRGAGHAEPGPAPTQTPSNVAIAPVPAPEPAPSASSPMEGGAPVPPSSLPSARPSAPKAEPPPRDASALRKEIDALDRVRRALAANDLAGAKRELSAYDRAFPFGALAPEARGLRDRIRKKEQAMQKP